MSARKLLRKGSAGRQIQDWLPDAIRDMIRTKDDGAWFWLPLKHGLCIGLTWQNGYDPEDTAIYGNCMDGEYVINAAVYNTDDFRINGDWAYYAETPYAEELEGGISICESDIENCYDTAKYLAERYYEICFQLHRRLLLPK